MKRFLLLLTMLIAVFTVTAQIEHSITIDQNTFRAIQSDALTGIAIDKIGVDSSRRPCARIKVKINRMNREDIDKLEVKIHTNNELTKCKTAEYNNGLIIEMTAKPATRFYFYHPEFGYSNEVILNLEANKEYYIEASLNQTFSIIVDSNIAGAEVYLDNTYKSTTDSNFRCTIKDVLIGKHTLKVVYGKIAHEQNIEVNSGSISFRQNINIATSEPQFVVFTVEPTSAVVTINNQHYALSDGAMNVVLDSGTYNYTITAAGYHPKSGTFIVNGEKVSKNIFLTADAATVTLSVADNAEIWINGELKGTSSWSGILNSGTYIFEARKAGYKTTTLSKRITSVEQQQRYTLPTPTPIVGSLIISGIPINADVKLDGKQVGQIPLKLNNILTGEHTLKISKEGCTEYSQTITVSENKTTTANIILKMRPSLDDIFNNTSKPIKITPIEIDNSFSAEQLYARGLESHNKRDNNSAIQYFRKAAQMGNAAAQYTLGDCYYYAIGISKDEEEAVQWYRKAAEQGDNDAQHRLGRCYSEGWGVTQNYEEAAMWYRKAAKQGNENSKKELEEINNLKNVIPIEIDSSLTADQLTSKGWEYFDKTDYSSAAQYFYKAAKIGHAEAQLELGLLYRYGLGVEENDTEAIKWIRKAAEQEYTEAQCSLGVCYAFGQGVTKNYTEAAKWYRKAAEQGDSTAQCYLADCYYNGAGVTQDYIEAIKWYRKSVEQENPIAQYALGYCYEFGKGVVQNVSKAVDLYRKSAEKGYKVAKKKLKELGY